MKTVFLCRYLHDEVLRREINEGLNVVETWNPANGFIFFGRGGEVASNRPDDQQASVAALHLLQSCLVYVNTLTGILSYRTGVGADMARTSIIENAGCV